MKKLFALASFLLLPAIFMPKQASADMLIAQASECPAGNPSEFVHAETKNFDVYICGGDLPHIYMGIDKASGKQITLPLRDTQDPQVFVAVNGPYRYVLNRSMLRVTKNGRAIVSERAKWIF